jgi:hypothetical protein
MPKPDYEEIFQKAVRIAGSQKRLRFLEAVFREDPDRVFHTADMVLWVMAHKLTRHRTPDELN